MGHLLDFDFKELAAKNGAKIFIEAGAGMGTGLTAALESGIFGELHSIEIVPELAASARGKFADNPQVTIHQGDPLDILPGLLARHPDERCFVWLDASFPDSDFGLSGYFDGTDADGEPPLQGELALFEARSDVVIADDLRLHVGQHWDYDRRETFSLPSYIRIGKLDLRRMHDRYEVHAYHYKEGFLLFLPRAQAGARTAE
jgi:hypothetical protein